MSTPLTRGRLVTVLYKLGLSALVFAGWAPTEALGQRLSSRFYITPSSPTALGQQVTLGMRPGTAGTTYRYVATMKVTGAWRDAVSVGCTAPQNIGTGERVSWTPPSGSYRVIVYSSLTGQKGRDSASTSYVVNAPTSGWLNIVVTQLPNPSPPGNLTFQLTTNDRGPGHAYQWGARFKSVTGSQVTDWSAASAGPTHLRSADPNAWPLRRDGSRWSAQRQSMSDRRAER